jgi:hypothetical protein
MQSRREPIAFGMVLAACVAAFFHESLLGGRILSPADVLLVEASFRPDGADDYEPKNRLLVDPVFQFQPWQEFNRAALRQGRLPLWNPHSGCGAPHLANGQSAVFDPFSLIAYLGTVPKALGWMAAARLWVAGMGMFLLARWWGLGRWGRWFAGLVYPFCGFLVVWLLYPVTPVAIWLPWLLLASDHVLRRPGPRAVGLLGLIVGLVIVGGHIQTSAHVLLASGLFALWRVGSSAMDRPGHRKALAAWGLGTALGFLLGAVQILPLGSYLARSPVWRDRRVENKPWYVLSRPRLLEAVCTALPYAYGSQRRGHPNLARGLGVNNLNESAGGYAGLATLVLLAPLGVRSRHQNPEVKYLAALAILGALGAFRIPPVDNLLRLLPVLQVTDNRRLVLWVAFGLTLLGGYGLDALTRGERTRAPWIAGMLLGAVLLAAGALAVPSLEPVLKDRALGHYAAMARSDPARDASPYRSRAERQVRSAIEFLPRYYGLAACELFVLAGMALASRRTGAGSRWLCPGLMALSLVELAGFGFGLNPAIDPEVQDPGSPVIARLRQVLAPGQRVIGIGEELPPNVLMRYGLSDARNYDSIELERSLRWFAPLYEPGSEALTSRRTITWAGVARARGRLREACVAAVVGSDPPPEDLMPRAERCGKVWIAWLDAENWAGAALESTRLETRRGPNVIVIEAGASAADHVVIRETWDPGWKARIDGRPAALEPHQETFMNINIPEGEHTVELRYEPDEVKLGLIGSALGLFGVILALTGSGRF